MRRVVRTFLVVFFGYLIQTCVMPHLLVMEISANLLFSVIAVITVAYSRFYTFGAACMAGILIEVMTGGLPSLNLIAYPAITLLGSLIFSDKSERKLEQERSQGRLGTNADARLRTLLCVLFDMVCYEAVHLLFIYLNGVDLGWVQFGRAIWSVLYTLSITALIMLPVRWLLGMYAKKPAVQTAG